MKTLPALGAFLGLPWVLVRLAASRSPVAARLLPVAPRIGLALLFTVTGLAHFTRAGERVTLLPPAVPARVALILVTGFLELAGAAGLVVSRLSRAATIALIAFLIAVFPANVWGAWNHTGIGDHVNGPGYL